MDLLGESDGGVVVGEDTGGLGVAAGERNAVVDVEDTVGTAGREDVACRGDSVGLGVDLALLPDAASRDGGLCRRGRRSVLAEVVGGIESSGDAGVELGVAVVGAIDNGELEATGVLEVQVELAVLGPLCGVVVGSNVSLEAVETKGNDLLWRVRTLFTVREGPIPGPGC